MYNPQSKSFDLLHDLPPEISIRIFAEVAVHNPKTFFSLHRVSLDWKNFLDFYKTLIQHDIAHIYETSISAPVFHFFSLCEIDFVFPRKFNYSIPLYLHYVNSKLPNFVITDDPRMSRIIQFWMGWAIDYAVYPWWLGLSYSLPCTMLVKALQTLKKDYTVREIGCIFLEYILGGCKPGDPENINIFDALKSAGISFENMNSFGLVCMHHLAILKVNCSLEVYERHLHAIVSNGFSLSVHDIDNEFGWDGCIEPIQNYSYSERFIKQTQFIVKTDWLIANAKGTVGARVLECKIDVGSLFFWQALLDQMMLNASSLLERLIFCDGFFQLLYTLAVKHGLTHQVFDFVFNNYPGGIGHKELEQGVMDGLPQPEFIGYLIDQGYTFSYISQLILTASKNGPNWEDLDHLGSYIVDEIPEFKEVFFREVLTRGPYECGFSVFDDGEIPCEKAPLEYVAVGIERMDSYVLGLIIDYGKIVFAETVFRECVHRNTDISCLSWFLESMKEAGMIRPQWLDDIIEFAQALKLEEIEDLLVNAKSNRC